MQSRQAAPCGCHKNSGESALWSCKPWWAAIQSNTPQETPSDKWQTGWWLVLAKQIWSKLQACWGLTCAALASAGIQTLYCVRNSTCGTPAASTRKAWSTKEFLLALTNKKKRVRVKPKLADIGFKWYWAQLLYDRHQCEIWWFWCILQLASPWGLSLCCCFQPWTKLDVYSRSRLP